MARVTQWLVSDPSKTAEKLKIVDEVAEGHRQVKGPVGRLGLPGGTSPVAVRLAAQEVLRSMSAESAEQVGDHEKHNIEARNAIKSVEFGGTGRGGVLNFLLGQKASVENEKAARAKNPDRTDGPDPIRKGPPTPQVLRNQLRLRTNERMTSSQVKVVLQQSAHASREAMVASWGAEEALSAEKIAGFCGFASAAHLFHLEDLGLDMSKAHLHQAAEVFGPKSYRHAFVVADMPDGKTYLIDTTFRQFFHPDKRDEGQIGAPGKLMRQTPRGKQIANEIIEKGFIELTDEVATAYGQALSCDDTARFTANDLRRTTDVIDYERWEFAGKLPDPPLLPPTQHRLTPNEASDSKPPDPGGGG